MYKLPYKSQNAHMIYAETPRLILRSLEKTDLPRIVELIGEWDVARWLVRVPYPYHLKDAEEFYQRMRAAMDKGAPEYFLLERKSDGAQTGAIGLHPPHQPSPQPGEFVVGYWLGRDYWGQGLMSEAIPAVIDHAFKRAEIAVLTATADPVNAASQNVLRKAGFACLGLSPCRDKTALRGGPDVMRWQITRTDYETRKQAA
jgi:RimJ/RimL family protein N-acetyltransferase